jgi:hypothetical protein
MMFSWAMKAILLMHLRVTRKLVDEQGNRHWRRVVFLDERGIYERWPSGHECPYTPTQDDMLATDWEIAA